MSVGRATERRVEPAAVDLRWVIDCQFIMRNDPQPTIATDEHLIFGRIKKVEVAVARVIKCDGWKQPSRQLAGRTTIKFWAVGQHQLWIVIVICDEPRLCTHVQCPIVFVMRSQRWPQVKLCGTHLAAMVQVAALVSGYLSPSGSQSPKNSR